MTGARAIEALMAIGIPLVASGCCLGGCWVLLQKVGKASPRRKALLWSLIALLMLCALAGFAASSCYAYFTLNPVKFG